MQQTYKYIIFSPYFGKLPEMFDLWAQSCGNNSQFLFIVFTDDNYKGNLPKNVQIKQMPFQALRQLIQSKFNFPISLESPYKLCDYKPAFGYIFEEYLQGCVYWGYCDMDLIFGDLSKFLPTENYDKISHLGHLCLYKNTPEITKAFMLPSKHKITYKDIFSSATHFAFDENEAFGINSIFRKNQLRIYSFEQKVADISPQHVNFVLSHYQNSGFNLEAGERIFEIENGRVWAHTIVGDNIEKKEYAYVHIQKRRMIRKFEGMPSKYLISPMGFESWQQPITAEFIKSRQKNVNPWEQLLHKLSVKRTSFPRALRRKWGIWKICCLSRLKEKKHL